MHAEDLSAAARRELERRLNGFGPDILDDIEALQLLCGLGKGAASRLLAHFGSLPEVVGAARADIARVGGERAAAQIKVAQDIARRVLTRPLRSRSVLSSSSLVAAYLRTLLVGAPRERFRVLFLDRRHRLIAEECLNEGTFDHAPVYPREVVRRALELNASGLILAHNHPSGAATPSAADIEITRQVSDAGRALRVEVLDHVLIAGQEAISFRTLGVLS
jgi:DNA repair protein RadC